jgi:hypothetical protein
MEMIDSNLRFASGLAITTSKVSTVLDGKKITDYAKGMPLYLNVYLDTVFTTAANGLTILLINSSGADPAYDTSSADKVLEVVPARLASAMLTTGLLARVPLPSTGTKYERIALWFLATTALVAGKITAFLSLGQDSDTVTTT